MGRLSQRCLTYGLFVGLFALGTPQAGRAADPQQVKFYTFDKVEIHGTFYPSDKGAKAPCALLLHEVGGNSEKEGWSELAKKLQKEKGMAVLTFDFRGHGESVNVDPDAFWQQPINNTLKGYKATGKRKEQIHYRDYGNVLQYATLINDITAAKNYLERRGDAGECNSTNVVVIGAESGAALGALWIYSECYFNRAVTAAPIATQARYDVEDIACGIWLSMTPSVGPSGSRGNAPVDKWVGNPVKEKVPMFFLYGEQDSRSASYSKRLTEVMIRGAKKQIESSTGSAGIKDTRLAGRELLSKSLNTDDLIVRYVTTILDKRVPSPRPKGDVDRVSLFRVPVEKFPLR
jgi:alpha-beta hydrolase superfamily lysophospholipase